MLIAIEAERANSKQKTGVEHYAKQLILHLAKIDRENRYLLYLRSAPEEWFYSLPDNFSLRVMPFPIFWTQLRISWELWRRPVDCLLVPASALPLWHPKNSLVTVHDVAWKWFPETFTWFNRNFLRWSTWFAVRKASRVIAVSEATKKDLQLLYPKNAGKIAVVHHGFERPEAAGQLKGFSLPERFVLFLSTIQPRKNLRGLIQAFFLLKKRHPEIRHSLVVVGRPGWKCREELEELSRHPDQIRYLGHVSDRDRLAILAHASVLAVPSFYEGFGMQILEAFSLGIPVAVSQVSSLPEVAGDAAVYFDPNDRDQIAAALYRLLSDSRLAEQCARLGRERLGLFSWDRCASQTLELLTNRR